MREIKFRFWSPYTDDLTRMIHEHDGWCEGIGINEALKSSQNDYDYKIMQYTGLKDKNGKGIAEGDLLKSGKTGLIYKVVWDQEAAAFTSFCTEPEKDFYMGPYSWEEAEIIGNIWEHPELIEL